MSKDSSSKSKITSTETLSGLIYRYIPVISILIGAGLLFLVGQILGLVIYSAVLGMFGYDSAVQSALLQTSVLAKLGARVAIGSVTVGLVWWLIRYLGDSPLEFLKLKTKQTLKTLKYAVIAFVIYALVSGTLQSLFAFLFSEFNPNQVQQLGYSSIEGMQYVGVFIALVIIPPITEEIFFRGFLYLELKRFVSLRVSAVLTSVVFGMAHLEFFGGGKLNWAAALDTFVLSLLLIWVLEKTKTLWGPILLHVLKNSIAFLYLIARIGI